MGLKLNGTNQKIEFGAVTDFEFSTEFSICGWLNINQYRNYNNIIGKTAMANGTGCGVFVMNNYLTAQVQTISNYIRIYKTPAPSGEFFYCMTFKKGSSGDSLKVYIGDAGAVGSGPYNEDIQPQTSDKLSISSGQTYGFADIARIYDLRVYNRELSSAEKESIRTGSGYDSVTDGLVGRWLMNEKVTDEYATEENSILDISGNDYHGTPANSPQYIDNPEGYYSGPPAAAPRLRRHRLN